MDTQVGSPSGICAKGVSPLLATVTADGVNTVTVDNIRSLRNNAHVDIANKTTGAVLAANVTITGITSAGVVTYSGADVAAVAGTHGLFPVGEFSTVARTLPSGGPGNRLGFDLGAQSNTVEGMRQRLIDANAAYYTTARLNELSYNDMVMAVRLTDSPASI